MQVQERNIHDPVPRNVSKFPIHQTYLTSDAEGNNKGTYKEAYNFDSENF